MTELEIAEMLERFVKESGGKGVSAGNVLLGQGWARFFARKLAEEKIEVIDRAADLDKMFEGEQERLRLERVEGK